MAVASSPVRRDELRAFLRSRRARVSPADVGLPDDGARRRTPGLRREELAALAGVGVSWYTWLEQGRDIHPSPEVLDALARALRLDAAERATLFALARTELPLPDSRTSTTRSRRRSRVARVVGRGAAPDAGVPARADDRDPGVEPGGVGVARLAGSSGARAPFAVVDAAGRSRRRAGQSRAGRAPLATWWAGFGASTRSTPVSPPTSSTSPSCTNAARGLPSGGASTRSTTPNGAPRRSSTRPWGRCACTTRRPCPPGRPSSG